MNKTIKILAALLPLFITSCTNDDANVTTTPQQDPVVTLSAGITRAGESGTGFANGDKVKITNVTRAEKGLPYSSVIGEFNGSSWDFGTQVLLWCVGINNTFRAVYPADADYSSLPTNQSAEYTFNSLSKWTTCEKTIEWSESVNTSEPLRFDLKSPYAMVVVEVSITGSIDYEFYFITNGNSLITPNKNNSTYQAILPAGDYSNGSKQVVSIKENSTKNEKKYILPSGISGFEAGKKYTFNLSIDASSSYSGAATRSAAPDNLTLVSVEPM